MPDDKPKQDDPVQSQRFIDMAREVEAKEDDKPFAKLFDKVAKLTTDMISKDKRRK